MTTPRTPQARRLLSAWRHTSLAARIAGDLSPGAAIAADVSEDGTLCLVVKRVPPGTLDPEFAAHGAGQGHGLFTPAGADWWLHVHALALVAAAAAGARPRGQFAAVFLHPDAITREARP